MFLMKRKPKADVVVFRANFYVDHTWTPKRCVCGLKVWSALSVNGACIPCCGHVDCNQKSIKLGKAL